jgi:general secretion pathway protein A
MYTEFYGLNHKPFDLTPDGDLLYLSDAHREGVAILRYGVLADKGFLMLTGGVGTGKTTLINTLLRMLKSKARVCLLNNPTLTRHEFYHFLAKKLTLKYNGNKGEFILQFSKLLDRCHKRGEKVLFIIDEAQVFPVKLLEEVRLLSNHAGEHNVLSIFLIGQPELQRILAHSRLLPLRQRIGIKYHLAPLTMSDTEQYITFRLNSAGAVNTALFTEQAIACIHEATRGNPRLINVLCDHALLSGFAKDLNKIDKKIILECIDEIRLPGEAKMRVSRELSQPQEPFRRSPKRTRKIAITVGIALILLSAGIVAIAYNKGWGPIETVMQQLTRAMNI